jgi:ParB-like chromosome segregation protein Spo0J
MEFHEAACIFPMMSDQEIDSLSQDIAANGLQVPVEIFNGQIIDGRNRWMACLKAGVDAETIEIDVDDPVAYVLSLNLHRRHLDETQRAMVAGRSKALYEEAAKERQLRKPKSVPVNLPEQTGDARDKAGESVGVSGRSVDHAAKVIASGSKELNEACDSGKVAISAAAKLAELPKAKQNEVIRKAREENVPLKKAVSKAAKHVTPKPNSDWSESELERREIVESGGTVLANKRTDKNLLNWASAEGLLTPIDRGTPWGNPFIVDADGDRDEVCDSYAWYVERKPSFEANSDKLRGRVLACWCYPDRCHGETLIEEFGL